MPNLLSVIVAHEPNFIKSEEAKFMNQLQEQQLHEINKMEQEERGGFIIDDLSGLTWTMRKMRALQAKIKEVQDIATAEIAPIEGWAKQETKQYQEDMDFFAHKISEYHRLVLAEDPRAKSIKTPYGVAKSTASKAAPEKVDETALIAYAKENDVPVVEVVTTEKLKWAELKKTLKVVERAGEQVVIDADGQIVPGVVVKPETVTFKVEVSD